MHVPTDGPCIDCGIEGVTFSVSPELWARVTFLPPNSGVLCPYCFEKRALTNGVRLGNWTVKEISFYQTSEETP